MTLQECYTCLNGSYEEAKTRLMNDSLVERFILKFPADPSMNLLRDAVREGNTEDAFRAAHTLKGVSANLAFTELQKAASALTEQLRPQNAPTDPVLFAAVEAAYEKTVAALNAYKAEK